MSYSPSQRIPGFVSAVLLSSCGLSFCSHRSLALLTHSPPLLSSTHSFPTSLSFPSPSENSIGDSGAEAVAAGLPLSPLSSLRLDCQSRDIPLTPLQSAFHTCCLSLAFPATSPLSAFLHLSSACSVSMELFTCPLRSLLFRLSDCGITSAGVTVLFRFLPDSRLTTLSLSGE